MPGFLSFFKRLCSSDKPNSITVTRPGLFEAVPDVSYTLVAPQPTVVSAYTGPDGGVTGLKLQDGLEAAAQLPWQQPDKQQLHQLQQHQQSWGHAISLYDRDLNTGQQNGDPIADCYGVITYQDAALLALADGVNWGERPRKAARAAVRGFLTCMHQELAVKFGGKAISSSSVFRIMQTAVQAAQACVLAADGTLTTLVGVIVLPQRWGGKHAALSVVIGDSPSYVWRAATGEVAELNYQPPLHGFHRDPRVCPGCLGVAVGADPDLSNISYALASLSKGDVVFLTSDGISDNFDPVIRKQASARAIGEGSSRIPGLNALSPSTCHKMTVADIAGVLKDACRQGTVLSNTVVTKQVQQQPVSLQEQQQQQQQEATAYVQQQLQKIEQQAAGITPEQQQQSTRKSPLPLDVVDCSRLTAQGTVRALLEFVQQATEEQRSLLEEKRKSSSADELANLLAALPGKMDHASVVAHRVG